MDLDQMITTTIIIIMIMIMTTIMIKIKSETSATINQIWEEAGKEGEQFELKVQVMDRIMMIGLKIYIARLKNNNQDNSSPFTINPNHQFINGVQQSKYIPIVEAVNSLPLLSEDPMGQVEIKVYKGEQVQYLNKMERNDKFQNMMSLMMNKLKGYFDEDEAMKL
ncbi:MAG: hypothetical protein EZS28_034876 [Streblomastix strix]|uniref:Uncharacterized protein n=1 Tax=Streblomastix strix TaxID=222440 RepID=A0A5J4UGT1_9EUKA|nr:MAG: hypothetical protein EZS28_034876 [Streblomastix strix]